MNELFGKIKNASLMDSVIIRRAWMMRKTLFFLFMSFSAFADCAVRGVEKDAPILCGRAMQGGILYGQTDWDVKGYTKGEVFVIGLDRDQPSELKLEFCKALPGAHSGGIHLKDRDLCKTYTYKIEQRKYLEQVVRVPDKFIKYPPKVQARIDRENSEIKKARAIAGKDDSLEFMSLSLSDTLEKFPISGVFGSRRIFNGQPKSPHRGLDIAAPTGTPATAIGAGRIVIAADMYLTGKTIFITHGHGITSAYFHLDSLTAKVGDLVKRGAVIGKIGATGRASGPHLHLGVYWRQTALDPQIVMLD